VRTSRKVGAVAASAAIIAAGWMIGNPVISTITPTATTSTTDTTTTDPTASATPTVITLTGDTVNTRFGTVQVNVVMTGSEITDVVAIKLTDADRKSVQISNRAAPILHDEVLASQSANVSNVSGATYTTKAYLQSLQSALDKANQG
jgi:uncharacterized protein with FMN-binding domain